MAGGIRVGGLRIDMALNLANLAEDVRKSTSTLTGLERDIKKITGGISAGFQAAFALAGVVAIKKVGDALLDLAKQGAVAGDIAAGFKKLGGSSVEIDRAKDATLGLVDSFELMEIANKGLIANVQGFGDNFSKVAELGAQLANTLGTDTKGAIEQVTQALIAGKAKGLENLGFVIDAKAAYADFAKENGLLADKLSESQKRAAVAAAAFGQIETVIGRLAPVTDSVTTAQEALSKTIGEVGKQIGIAINENEDLRQAFRDVQSAIKDIDWDSVATGLSNIISVAVKAASALASVIAELAKLADTRSDSQKTFDKQAKEAEKFEAALNKLGDGLLGAKSQKDLQGLTGGFVEFEKAFAGFMQKAPEARDHFMELQQAGVDLFNTLPKSTDALVKSQEQLDAEADAAEKAAEALKKAREEVDKLRSAFEDKLETSNLDAITSGIEGAIGQGDVVKFDQLKEQFRTAVQDGFVREFQEALDKGAVGIVEIMALGAAEANEKVGEFEDNMRKSIDDLAAHTRDVFAAAFDDIGGQLSEISAAFGVDLSGVFDTLGKFLSDDMKAGILSGIGEALGFGTGAEAAAGLQAAVEAFGTVSNAFSNRNERDKANRDNSGTGAAAGSGVGAVAGGVIGYGFGGPLGAAVGAAIGSSIGEVIGGVVGGFFGRGSQDPDTQARHAFANFLEESFSKLTQVSFFDSSGRLKNTRGEDFNFIEGDGEKFKPGTGWTDKFNSMESGARDAFFGIGEAMEELLGLTEDVGSQIAFLLAENLGGNLDNARLLVMQLGISMEDMVEQLVKIGETGELSWHAVEVAIQGVTNAYKPGLVAINDVAGAFQELTDSGGRGIAAIKAIKDIAIETMEAGGKTLEDLRKQALAQGVDPQIIEDYIQAAKQRGLDTLEEIANATTRVTGGVVADIESLNEAMAQQWKEMGENLQEIKETLEEIPKEVESNITFNLQTNMDDATKEAIEAGLFEGTGIDTAVQTSTAKLSSTPKVEAPRTTRAARGVNVSNKGTGTGNINISIDARNAQKGVHADIMRAMSTMEDRAVRRAVGTIVEANRRGGSY